MTAGDDRRYPKRPIVGVGALIFDRGRILMAQRGKEPLKGWWSLPGGALEIGESLDCAVRREVREETGLEIEPLAASSKSSSASCATRPGARVSLRPDRLCLPRHRRNTCAPETTSAASNGCSESELNDLRNYRRHPRRD